jgi:hypothetical protein
MQGSQAPYWRWRPTSARGDAGTTTATRSVLVAQKAYGAVPALAGQVTCSSGTFLLVLWLLTDRRLFDLIPWGAPPAHLT